jgi:hypothetical protein
VCCSIDDIDEAPETHAIDPAETDDPGDRNRVGQTAGFDHDCVQSELGISEFAQRIVEPAVIRQAADAAAGDGGRFVNLSGHQHGFDIELTEVVDNHADSRLRTTKHVVEETRLASAEVAGQRNDGDRLHARPSGSSGAAATKIASARPGLTLSAERSAQGCRGALSTQ